MSEQYYMEEALKEAKKAFDHDDVPVGAVIVFNNQIIARSYNKKELCKDATAHAEILAIQEACQKIGNWHLSECTLYVTLEPCLMCAGAIIQSRIKKIVYATSSPKFGYIESVEKLTNGKNNHIPKIETGVCEEESIQLLKCFFQRKRRQM